MAKRPRRRSKRPLTSWEQSDAFRAIGRAAITAFNRRRGSMPKCQAARKSDGQPCQQLAMENGRCHLHGGRVPRGDQWHKRQWPTKDGPAVEKRLHAKEKQIARQTKAREKRLEEMTPEERERHEEWQRTHRAGSAAKRHTARVERESTRRVKSLMAVPDVTTPELEKLGQEIERLKMELAIRELFA